MTYKSCIVLSPPLLPFTTIYIRNSSLQDSHLPFSRKLLSLDFKLFEIRDSQVLITIYFSPLSSSEEQFPGTQSASLYLQVIYCLNHYIWRLISSHPRHKSHLTSLLSSPYQKNLLGQCTNPCLPLLSSHK